MFTHSTAAAPERKAAWSLKSSLSTLEFSPASNLSSPPPPSSLPLVAGCGKKSSCFHRGGDIFLQVPLLPSPAGNVEVESTSSARDRNAQPQPRKEPV